MKKIDLNHITFILKSTFNCDGNQIVIFHKKII